MKKISIGRKLFLTIVSLFLLFAVLFIVFQQAREREYKINTLNLRLQDYNDRMDEALRYLGDRSEKTVDHYVKLHPMKDLRVTLVRPDGTVIYDNDYKDYAHIRNHRNRKEIIDALRHGEGYDINRPSATTHVNYFYTASYYPDKAVVIRTALPYNNDLSRRLRTDQHYIWFTLVVSLLLAVVLYRFTKRLGTNITNLRHFAKKAEHNDVLNTEELAEFPDDELGEISEHIVKLFMRWQKTKEEQNVLKRQLTQNVAHELKTPVSSIQGYLETIISNPNISDEQKQVFLQRCYAQSQRLTSLLQDISTLNRLDDAPDMKQFEPVDIFTMIMGIEREIALQLDTRSMHIVNRIPSGLVVNGNQSLLYSVFRNMFDNALAYAGNGTTISITCEDAGEMYHFVFADDGVGVGEEHLERLFERFYRVDKGRSRKLGGTGLGLAIVKNAIIVHGGSISASMNEPHGLKLDFTLKK